MTRTFATLVVSKQTFEEIASKLREAGYDHVFLPSHDTIGIDMNGIVLQGIRKELESKGELLVEPKLPPDSVMNETFGDNADFVKAAIAGDDEGMTAALERKKPKGWCDGCSCVPCRCEQRA